MEGQSDVVLKQAITTHQLGTRLEPVQIYVDIETIMRCYWKDR